MLLSPVWNVTYPNDDGRFGHLEMYAWKDFISKSLRKHHLFV